MGQPAYPPRFIRAGDAPGYLGMCRDEFNKTVRPYVKEVPIGIQGIAFDRYELDAWADNYIQQKAIEKTGTQGNNPSRSERRPGDKPWREKRSPASTRKTASGTSIKSSEVNAYKKALELVTGKKPSNT